MHTHHESFPRGPLLAAGALVVFVLAAVGWVRLAGGMPGEPEATTLLRELRFADRPDGGVEILDHAGGRTIEVVEPGTNGFLRATLRGLVRERRREGMGDELPFRLTASANGRLTLEDPATRRRIDLQAFGPDNAAAFARLVSDRWPSS
jgi:putative photosynthetic complex assembly protein